MSDLDNITLVAALLALRAREGACERAGISSAPWRHARRKAHLAFVRSELRLLQADSLPALIRLQAG